MRKKLVVGICNSQETVPSRFFWSFLNIRPVCEFIVVRGTHPWDVIRNNQIISKFLKTDADYFVKMDVDQSYPPDYFEVMVPLLETHDVIGPMIYDRWPNNDFVPLCFNETEGLYPRKSDAFDNRTGILRMPHLHTNCFYNRYVLEALKPPWYEAYQTEDGLNRANHVDRDFMQKISKAGFEIYINFDVVVKHLAEVPVSREVYERWNGTRTPQR
jgi:hypothetical protein